MAQHLSSQTEYSKGMCKKGLNLEMFLKGNFNTYDRESDVEMKNRAIG